MYRKLCYQILLTLALILAPVTTFAQQEITIWQNNQQVICDVAPQMKNDRVFLPARSLYTAIGGQTSWDDTTKTATILLSNGTHLKLTVDSTTAYVNGQAVTLEAAPFIQEDRLMLPLAFAADYSGLTLEWNAAARSITIYNKVDLWKQSVVMIKTDIAQGSGIVLSSDGIICTNYHVIEDASAVSIAFQNGDYYTGPATVVGLDTAKDVAILSIEKTDLTPIAIGDASTLEIGDAVTAIGSPNGNFNTVTAGSVTGNNGTVITTDAYITNGSSGGALINANGELVGMTFAYSANMYLSIPVNTILEVAQNLAMPIEEMARHHFPTGIPYDLSYTEDDDYYYVFWGPVEGADWYQIYISDQQDGSYQAVRKLQGWSFPYCVKIAKDAQSDIYIRVVAIKDNMPSLPSQSLYLP